MVTTSPTVKRTVGTRIACGGSSRWKLQVIGNAKLPDDELVDLQTPYSSAPNREATDRDSADGQCTNCQRAESLCTDCESSQGVRVPGTEEG